MDEVVICDTNAVIQLAIICPAILKSRGQGLHLFVHPKVISEIKGLSRNHNKMARLGKELNFILKEVEVSKGFSINESDYEMMDETIVFQEEALPSNLRSAPSSPTDRFFLILAQCNDVKLLTRESTLFNLGKVILSIDQTWGISDAILYAIDFHIVTKEDVKRGLLELDQKSETLSERCMANLKPYF